MFRGVVKVWPCWRTQINILPSSLTQHSMSSTECQETKHVEFEDSLTMQRTFFLCIAKKMTSKNSNEIPVTLSAITQMKCWNLAEYLAVTILHLEQQGEEIPRISNYCQLCTIVTVKTCQNH